MLSGSRLSFQLLAFGAAVCVAAVAVTQDQMSNDVRRNLLPGTEGYDAATTRPTDFYCVLVMKFQQELECFFIAWPGTTWNLSYITNLSSNSLSGSVNFACERPYCGVNISGPAQHYTTYNFTLWNLSASVDDLHAITYHEIYSDDYLTRLDPPEDVASESGKRKLLIAWSAPLSSYGELWFDLEGVAARFGLEHRVSYYLSAKKPRLIEVKTLTSSQLTNISLVLLDLQPFSTYEVLISSRVNGSAMEQAWSRPAIVICKTLEEEPAVAPKVFREGFSLHACNESRCKVKLYWQGIPELSGKSNGIITGYLIRSAIRSQEMFVSGSRCFAELQLDMKETNECVILGVTSAGSGPPSATVRIPSLSEVLHLDNCSLQVEELNKTTAKVHWSVVSDQDIRVVRLYWCLTAQSECSEIRTTEETFGTNGSAVITTKDSIYRYRFGLSAAASDFASGIVWQSCPGHPVGDGTIKSSSIFYTGLPPWAVAAIVGTITAFISVVSLLLWRFLRAGKSIKNIGHIPKTHSVCTVNAAAYKYEVVDQEELAPSPVHTDCIEKGGGGLTQTPKRHNDDYVQQPELELDLAHQAMRLEASLDYVQSSALPAQPHANSELHPGDCSLNFILNSKISGSSGTSGYQVSFSDLVAQARAQQYKQNASTNETKLSFIALPDGALDESCSVTPASLGDSVTSDGKQQAEGERQVVGGIKKPTTVYKVETNSNPSSDYVVVSAVDQQIPFPLP